MGALTAHTGEAGRRATEEGREVRTTRSTAGKLLGVIATSLGLLLVPTEAAASRYGVHECTPGQGTVNDAQVEGTTTGYTANNTCGLAGGDYLQMGSSGPVGPGQSKAWAFTAPAGTRINRATGTYLLQGSADNGGHKMFFFYRGVGQGSDQVLGWTGAGNGGGGFDTDLLGGAVSRLGVGIVCTAATTCPNRAGIYSRIGDLGFAMEDTVAPNAPSLSGPALGGWIGGASQLDFSVSDSGAGVYLGSTSVNGAPVDLEAYCVPERDGSGAVTVMKPCPSSGSGSSSIDPSNPAFQQGGNDVRVCVYEYGEADLQSACRSETVRVDTVAPGAPVDLAVSGGGGWRRDNDFDLSWTNPVQVHAPIVGASVRTTGPGGYTRTEYFAGPDLSAVEDVRVPAAGEFTAQVYLRDAAGNELPVNGSSVHLRFDDTVPVGKSPHIANGWISREELAAGYLQSWEPTAMAETPPSGIAGYRVVVNTSSDTDPCSGAVDLRTCGGRITDVGVDSIERTLLPGDVEEGINYVHVVPISGSGMRATDVRRTQLKADFTDPVTHLSGDGGGGWINHDASLALTAVDQLSGMQDTGEFPSDEPPVVALDVGGTTTSGAPGVAATVSGEGVHRVRWCARDLAGNGDCPAGTPVDASDFDPSHVATVRIDKSAPTVAFADGQDPDDPDKLVAPVSDALSGVVAGEISYRQVDGEQWKALDTALADGRLIAWVDSGDLRPGTTYEFRAQSTDAAGNKATSVSRQNGEPMRVTGPFRTITAVADLRVNGRPKARVRYGKRPRVTGELVGEDGLGVPNAAVRLVSTYFSGSKRAVESTAATTDAGGGFSVVLPKGPGRTVVAEYRGDRRYLGTRSAPAKVSVRSGITLNVPRVVDSDRGITFRGQVRAKGATLGRRGKRLEVQVRVGRAWRTVARSFRARRSGRFSLNYRFTAEYPREITYEFRAAVLKERGFPYLPSKSRKRRVTVTP